MAIGNATIPSSSSSSSSLGVALPVRLIAGISYLLFNVFGLVGNCLLIIILVQGRHFFSKHPFYVIVYQMVATDLMQNAVQFWLAIPITLAGQQIYGATLWLYAPAFFDTVSYNATLFFTLMMTLDRFSVFLTKSVYQRIFVKPYIQRVMFCMWVIIFIIVANSYLCGCQKTFSSKGFYFFTKCSNLSWYGEAVYNGMKYQSYFWPIVMFILYLIIFAYIRYQGNTTSPSDQASERRKREISLLVQGFIICGFLELQTLAYTFMPKIKVDGDYIIYLTVVQNCISITNNGINSYIYFVFNQEIRSRLLKLLGCNKINDAVQPVSVTGTQSPRGIPMTAKHSATRIIHSTAPSTRRSSMRTIEHEQ